MKPSKRTTARTLEDALIKHWEFTLWNGGRTYSLRAYSVFPQDVLTLLLPKAGRLDYVNPGKIPPPMSQHGPYTPQLYQQKRFGGTLSGGPACL
jgi:hypothetical protein